jgi:hypothetical protein
MSALPETWKEDFQNTAKAPIAMTVITRMYINTGISIDFKWGRSQKKIRALVPTMINIPDENQWEIGVRDEKLKM